MSDDKALVPVDQRTVSFYGDEITAVLVAADESEQVFVPIRPICDLLGIAWSSQRRRILRDPILSEVMRPVTVTVTGTGAMALPVTSSFRRASMQPYWRFWKNGAGRRRRQNSTRYFRGPGPGSNSKRRIDSERTKCELR